jgi:hypothetical protein
VAHACVILATQEAEIRRITVQSQQGQIVCETLSRRNIYKKGLVEWLTLMSSNPSTAKKKKIKTIPPTIKQVVSPYFFFSAGDETLVSVHARKVLYN